MVRDFRSKVNGFMEKYQIGALEIFFAIGSVCVMAECIMLLLGFKVF